MSEAQGIDPRIQLLLDKEEIRELTYRFARGVDRRDAELMRSCYHEDAMDFHGVFDGPAPDYVRWAEANMPRIADRTTHHVSNGLIEVDGDQAYAESYVLAAHRYTREDGTTADCLVGARYVDHLERRDGSWRIKTRQLVWEWVRDDVAQDDVAIPGVARGDLRWGEHGRTDPAYTLGREAA